MKACVFDHVGLQRVSRGERSNQVGLSVGCCFREDSSDEERRHLKWVSGGPANIAGRVGCFGGRRHRGGYAEMSGRPFTIYAKPLILHSKSPVGARVFGLAPPAPEEGDEQ